MSIHWINKSDNSVVINGQRYYNNYGTSCFNINGTNHWVRPDGTSCFNINGTNHWVRPDGTIRILDPLPTPINTPQRLSRSNVSSSINRKAPTNTRQRSSISNVRSSINQKGLRCRKCKKVLSIPKNGPFCFGCRNK